MANIRSIPVWEFEGISEQEYLARQNALVYDASFIVIQILETVQNDIDPITDESIISMIQHEDEETINILENDSTIINETTGITGGSIVQQIEAIIASRNG